MAEIAITLFILLVAVNTVVASIMKAKVNARSFDEDQRLSWLQNNYLETVRRYRNEFPDSSLATVSQACVVLCIIAVAMPLVKTLLFK